MRHLPPYPASMVPEGAARYSSSRSEGAEGRGLQPANPDPNDDDIFRLEELSRRALPSAGAEARSSVHDPDGGEMEMDLVEESGDDWQAQLSRAIEDIFENGEPVNTQRGIKAHANAKRRGKIVRPADERAEPELRITRRNGRTAPTIWMADRSP